MPKIDTTYLNDIYRAIQKIDQYVSSVNYSTFEQEEMRQDAVIRQLEIIGEATNKLSEVFLSTNPDFPIKEAISMRNFLIHGYDDVDLKVVWKTIQEDIPTLKKKVQTILHADK